MKFSSAGVSSEELTELKERLLGLEDELEELEEKNASLESSLEVMETQKQILEERISQLIAEGGVTDQLEASEDAGGAAPVLSWEFEEDDDVEVRLEGLELLLICKI